MQKSHYRAIAYGGDLSANGMSTTATIIRVPAEHADVMNEFMNASEDLEYFVLRGEDLEGGPTKRMLDTRERAQQAYNKLQDLGIFGNKYYARSRWAWMELPIPADEE